MLEDIVTSLKTGKDANTKRPVLELGLAKFKIASTAKLSQVAN